MIIHSFDGILRAPRSMHSIDIARGRRIPLPRPVPWISAVYFATVELCIMALDNVVSLVAIFEAVIGTLVSGDVALAAYLTCYVIIPGGIVWLSMNVEIDGRAPHRWIVSVARFIKRPSRTIAGRKVRAEGARSVYRGRVRVWWDLNTPSLHHGWVDGGKVTSIVPARFTYAIRHRCRVMVADGSGAEVRNYEVDGKLEVRP